MSFEMRVWSRKIEDIDQLVEAFFQNDPYYPRPRLSDPLYMDFRLGYIEAYPQDSKEAEELAVAFLGAIEREQAKRDSTINARE